MIIVVLSESSSAALLSLL